MPVKKQVSSKVTQKTAQVRKANEIGSGGGFLSGLGFTQKKPEPVISQNDQDETIIVPKVSNHKDISTATPIVAKEKNDFLTNFLAGKDDKIVPNKIDLKEIHQEPKSK